MQGFGRKSSDHQAILLRSNIQNWGLRPFKAFNYWWREDKFLNGVLAHWRSLQGNGINLHKKLKSAINFMKDWNKNIIGDCFKKVIDLKNRLNECDATSKVDPTTTREVELALQAAY